MRIRKERCLAVVIDVQERTYESLLFELNESADSEVFKELSRIVK
jgi:hypothetical protein